MVIGTVSLLLSSVKLFPLLITILFSIDKLTLGKSSLTITSDSFSLLHDTTNNAIIAKRQKCLCVIIFFISYKFIIKLIRNPNPAIQSPAFLTGNIKPAQYLSWNIRILRNQSP